ncbi:dipeptidase [Paenibacillus sp. GCM10027626]|uniref:dipeptidase n=1 Tax=Paenibacillus sp. GCM10027626 TaxID=3273411 RepID=UPI0036271776
MIRTVDFHCDALYKLLTYSDLEFTGDNSNRLDVTLPRLKEARALLQTFAIFIPDKLGKTMEPILESIDLFQRKVLASDEMMFIRTAADLKELQQNGKIGALLSLEGADGLQGNMAMLRILFALGVRALGLTWNNANWGADGAMEPRKGGLTGKGVELVKECNRLGIILDVSHLSERSFWDMVDKTTKPLIASHSNAQALCNHPRNLTDEQLRELIAMDGLIGVTFVPYFVADQETVTVDDVVRHVEYICELGGEKNLMFGSDFDGIDQYVNKLCHPGEVANLMEALHKKYSSEQLESFFSGNAMRFLETNLPH